ncbi:MAG: hypothetical protein LBS57_12560 [Treponema sp.]|jgi:hypothetical protein|nr:hypothetical protein [Treponema sp.]
MKLHSPNKKNRETDNPAAYRRLTETLRKGRGGVTVADMTAASALPLALVQELLPRAADEYSARLEVSESGEIVYSFPRGFVSRYRGFKAGLKRFLEKSGSLLVRFASLAFKIWIMFMLIGYFVLFMVIALGSLFISVSVNSKNSSGRRNGGSFNMGIFSLLWRLWFYSELTRPVYRDYGGTRGNKASSAKRPMHRAIFSFVFGEEDPNRDWENREKKALIAYIQSRRGLISLPEFMGITGQNSADAGEAILAFCAEFGGYPEATDEGTLVYRFDKLLLRSDKEDRSFGGFSSPIRRLKKFSGNSKTMNVWFGIINSVNLLFGTYFFYNALSTGVVNADAPYHGSWLYGMTYVLFEQFAGNSLPFIGIVLGVIPLIFSLLFWLIPALRFLSEKKENKQSRLENFKRIGFSHIWDKPLHVETANLEGAAPECRPADMDAARDRVIKDLGAYSVPEVEINDRGVTVYSFRELEREKEALEKYRASVDPKQSEIGRTVFDSDA